MGLYTKLIHCGSEIEVFDYEQEPIPIKKVRRRKIVRDTLLSRSPGIRRIKRTRKAFVRFAKCALFELGAPYFATFTFVDILPLRRTKMAFHAFNKRMQRVYPNFKYIAVHEWQKRGAVHFHALVWGIPQDEVTNERKRRRIQNIWRQGYMDIINTDGSPRLATYMAKYMLKALYDDRNNNARAYSSSSGLPRPQSFNSVRDPVAVQYILEGVDKQLELISSYSYDTQYLGKVKLTTYKNNI